MPADPARFPYRNELRHPVIGLEAEEDPPWRGELADRRERRTLPPRVERRERHDRRAAPPPRPSPRLARSAYETVFRHLGAGKRLQIGDEILTPVSVRGWYHAVFETEQGEERLLTIDQVLEHISRWRA